MKVDLEVGLKMVKAHDPGARLKMVKVAHLSDPYLPPVHVCFAPAARVPLLV